MLNHRARTRNEKKKTSDLSRRSVVTFRILAGICWGSGGGGGRRGGVMCLLADFSCGQIQLAPGTETTIQREGKTLVILLASQFVLLSIERNCWKTTRGISLRNIYWMRNKPEKQRPKENPFFSSVCCTFYNMRVLQKTYIVVFKNS